MKRLTLSVLRKLKRMGWRLAGILLVISLAMGMTVCGFYGASVFDYSVERYFEDGMMPDMFVTLESPSNESQVDAVLSGVAGLGAYDMRLKAGGLFSDDKGDVPVVLLGVRDPARTDIGVLSLESGKYFANGTEAVAISGMEERGVGAGEEIGIRLGTATLNLTVTGTVSTPEYMIPSSLTDYGLPFGGSVIILYMDLDALQAVAGDGVNDIVVMLGGASPDEVSDALAPFGVKGVVLQDQHPSKTFMEIGSAKMGNMMPLIGSFFMLIGFISVFMTMYRLVRNDSRAIGVLMSMGYAKSEIIRAYLAMGAAIALAGAFLGTLFAVGMTYGVVAASLAFYPQLKMAFPLDVMPFLLGLLFVAFSVMLSTYLPVLMVTRTTVREALDYKPSAKVKVVKVSPRRLSRVTLMGLRNSVRNPARTALTIIVVAMTIGVSGSWLVMTDSASSFLFEMLDSDRWDVRADFSAPMAVGSLNATGIGLNESEVDWLLPFSHSVGSASYAGSFTSCIMVACDDWARAKKFNVEEGELDFGKAVITNIVARELGVGVGDRVEFVVGGRSVSLPVSAVVYDSFVGALYADRATLSAIAPPANCTGVFVKLADSSLANADASAKAMRGADFVSNVVVQQRISDQYEELMSSSFSLLYVFFIFSLGIAFVVAASAVIISTMERDVEFATLDTLGVRRTRIWLALIAEMGILAVASAALGVPFAYLFGWLLSKVMAEVIFYFPILFVVGSSMTIFLIGLLFVLLSSAVPIRYAESVDTEKTIRERTAG